jgi:ferredoxin
VTPMLLPWLPGRAFSLKGAIAGFALAAATLALWGRPLDLVAAAAVLLAMPAWASWIAMNFTGTSTYTSPTGVEKEMRAAMPLQAIGLVLGVALWIGSAWFSRGGAEIMALRYLPGVVTLEYDESKCTGCRMCAEVCPHAVFAMEGKRAVVADRDACMECGACQRNCAAGAITVDAGVGCAAAIVQSWITGRPPSCGCDETQAEGSGCC